MQSFRRSRKSAAPAASTPPQIVDCDVAVLRESGIENINIDLIAGLSGQTDASWRESLDWIERLAPPHVSVYMLEVDEDSRLGSEVLLNGERYGAPEIPSEDLTVELYEMAVERLAMLGIARYEISNFARPGCESHHNLKYWRLEPYVGFGADAHSFDGARRWQNAETPAEYVERQSPEVGSTTADAAVNPSEEKFFVGLRLAEGIRPNLEEWRRYDAPISRFLNEGLLERHGGTLRLTESRRAAFQRSVPGVPHQVMIDLRSDTVTKPTPAMRRAMWKPRSATTFTAKTPPSTGWSSAPPRSPARRPRCSCPPAPWATPSRVKLHTQHGQEVICEARAHVLELRAVHDGLVFRLSGAAHLRRGRHPDLGRRSAARSARSGRTAAPTGLIEIENTHNMAGGTVYPLRCHPRNLRRRP